MKTIVAPAIWCITAVLAGCATVSQAAPNLQPRIRFESSMGDFVIQLDVERSPQTALNFSHYVHDGFYDKTLIHRVIKGGLIQGGGYTTRMEKKVKELRLAIKAESGNGLANLRGSVAMSRVIGRSKSAQSQFYINLADNTSLDQSQSDGRAYIVFGQVVEGMDVIDRMGNVPVGTHPGYAAGKSPLTPQTPIVIARARFEKGSSHRSVKRYVENLVASRIRKREEDASRQAAQLKQRIKEIEARAGSPLITTPSGLRFVDLKIGGGAPPEQYETVEVHYKASLVDGVEFDNTYGRESPLKRRVDSFVPALREALSTMNEGGRRILVVPPEIGFGRAGVPGSVPPNSTVIFELELLQISDVVQPSP